MSFLTSAAPAVALLAVRPYTRAVYATLTIDGKPVRFRLPAALASAWRRNAGKTMTDEEVIAFVEEKRRQLALRRAKPCLASRP
jgi:hypothetical protein